MGAWGEIAPKNLYHFKFKKLIITDKQVFLVTGINSGMTGPNQHNWPDFSVRERFLRSWVNNLMVFKKRPWS